MKKIVIGILAPVDAGKTTLSESILYSAGIIKRLGRVDKGDAFLDNYSLERERGITIFSKQARFELDSTDVTLLDTPGHVDFSADMERTLQVLDYAVLVVSGADGVQGHTLTLWRLLSRYDIPVFLFVNKMDQSGTNKEALLEELKQRLDDGIVDFTIDDSEKFYEHIAVSDEFLLDTFLETGCIKNEDIVKQICNRKVYPCFFGSALKNEGVDELLQALEVYTCSRTYPEEFGARVYKISRDEQGNRLTYMKIMGGALKVRQILKSNAVENNQWEEKVNQIRLYSGDRYEKTDIVEAGDVCAVTGLTKTYSGEAIGVGIHKNIPILEPVLTYSIILPEDMDISVAMLKLKLLEEEMPELHIVWNERLNEIQAKVMGEVQIDILKNIIANRFNMNVEFGVGSIVYKETITDIVEGVGHFEPLRHYAEVHLILEPGEIGSGLQFSANCSDDILDKNWQRLVLTHLEEKEHIGVLTGSAITDMKITLVSGKAHTKHTEGGDFRQATYRAVRQGLKTAQSVLLEPYYRYTLEVPEDMIGRAMTDIERMQGTFSVPENSNGIANITGKAPVSSMNNYQQEVMAYTKGQGKLMCILDGYAPCHNEEEIIASIGYDSEKDVENPTSSVFCAHGAGFIVPYNKVSEYMHMDMTLVEEKETVEALPAYRDSYVDDNIGLDEIEDILNRTFYSNADKKTKWKSNKIRDYVVSSHTAIKEKLDKYLLVDGYNIIHAWEEFDGLIEDNNLDGARDKLMDIMCNYQSIVDCKLILVFDAYKVKGHETTAFTYNNIKVVYTKEAETADQYIERFAHENGKRYEVTVATSDGLEQIIIRGAGCRLYSAREFRNEVIETSRKILEDYRAGNQE